MVKEALVTVTGLQHGPDGGPGPSWGGGAHHILSWRCTDSGVWQVTDERLHSVGHTSVPPVLRLDGVGRALLGAHGGSYEPARILLYPARCAGRWVARWRRTDPTSWRLMLSPCVTPMAGVWTEHGGWALMAFWNRCPPFPNRQIDAAPKTT